VKSSRLRRHGRPSAPRIPQGCPNTPKEGES
jgi:hypothetical protein